MTTDTTNNMMDSFFNSDPEGLLPPHKITTDHPYMATLGLSTFTTGTLYRWWNKKDGEGGYENHKHFSDISEESAPLDLLLGTNIEFNTDKSSDIGKGQFSFEAWRKEGDSGAGHYLQHYADEGHTEEWTFSQAGSNEAGKPRSYTYDDINLWQYDDRFFKPDGTLALASDRFEIPNGQGGQEEVFFLGADPITNIITLNDAVNKKELETIDKSTWSQEQFAQAEFILDIQSSKRPYVEWSGYVPFEVNLHNGEDTEFTCKKPEWVKYRLTLYPNSAPRSARRGIAMAKPTFASPPVDSLGRKYQFKEDGRFSAFPEGFKVAEVVGDLDMSFNEYTGKWEAGSKQMVAIVTQPITQAQVVSSERLRNLSPEEMLRNPSDPNSHIIWGSGGAFPINMQNGNPMQWTPNYAQPSEVDSDGKFSIICPKESDEKASLRVFNASSKELGVDQYVLLNQIDGLWFAIDFPSGIPGDDTVSAGFDGLWDFTYFATNQVHYFRDTNFNRLDASDIEGGYHKAYYEDDPYNSGTFQSEPNPNQVMRGGFHQFSSFDMMDNEIAGTRVEGNAYGITNPIEGPNGETVESDYNGLATGGFFGCIFPDGYDNKDVGEYRADRTFVATPTTAQSGASDGSWISTSEETILNGVSIKFFHGGGIAKVGRPFNDGLTRQDFKDGFVNEIGELVPMFDDADTSLTQLPADIALNASMLNAENGQPLTSLHILEQLYSLNPAANKEKVRNLFSYGKNWLYRKYDDDDVSAGIKDFTESSAFDFKPKRANRIMFRPLKVEAYAQFGSVALDHSAAENKRVYFNNRAMKTMTSNKRPASEISYQREFQHNINRTPESERFSVPGMMGNIYRLHNSFWGLQLNVDIPASPQLIKKQDEDWIFKISPQAFVDSNAGRFHQQTWGFTSNEWAHGGGAADPASDPSWRSFGTQRPAGAVGVIGAIATCTANTNIKFESTCKLGMWGYSYAPALGEKITFHPSWGTGDGYKDDMTTNLFVKVYHSWPREQTVYDPRYYAVHHFNAGILDETTEASDAHSFKIDTVPEQLTQTGADGNAQNYPYLIDQPKYEIDIRKPCAKQPVEELKDEDNRPFRLAKSSKLWGTRSEDEDGVLCEALPKSMWNIDTQRRAKLLPFKYGRSTVVIPKVKVTLPNHEAGLVDGKEQVYKNGGYAVILTGLQDPETLVYPSKTVSFYDLSKSDGLPFKTFDPLKGFAGPDSEDVVMIVKNPGTGGEAKAYKVGDTFVTPTKLGSEAMITVTSVYAEGFGDNSGKIESFEVSIIGYDFDNTGFTVVEEGKPIKSSSTGMSLSSGGSQPSENGVGFNCVLVRGVVDDVLGVDDKPLIATSSEANRISIKSEKRGETTGGAPSFGLLTDTYELDVEISKKSTNNKYDLFFHFHNDVSLTFMTNQNTGGATGPAINDEQYIDLTITTN